ncbi:BTAD domain-containing putative transcriptional regulator [Actinoplanes friuliensis]|uniref:Regulatory protein afsR n=1 Tax=Actinoplanes friuliensis DSM 7358 TaxID=1246995 RepID=U5VTD8_9ACTN|nr:BTAD domain-containing putative transcriptional regulator [Actinoplanes friuliensis]AGZ40109.1 Regulatory protein afsR [Actinoplanes friuliensis DSM 7358]
MDIAVLGPVELRSGSGTAVPVAGARLRTLLVLLALDAGRAVSTGRLADGVWGDDQPAAAGNALQALISRLRRAAPGLAIAATPAGYRLDLDRDRVDAHRFARLVSEGRCDEALALWRGPTEFPDVARADAVRLDELRLAAWQDSAEARLRAGGGAELVAELEAVVAEHPLHEPLAGLLMRALVTAGHPGRALTVFERLRAGLADTLGADPSPELAALHVETLRGQQRRARGNLPAGVSSFVGREDDLRTVRKLIAEHRLVTLTGPGGSGKTRLSVEAGQSLTTVRPDGVWRVELAPVSDPAEVPQAILTALRLRSQIPMIRPGRSPLSESVDPLARLTEALAGKDLLLILDNCEHLIDAAATVADALLRAAPGLRLLATSREPLGIPGEQLWPVEPLALPPTETQAASFPAVRLLLDRAVAARPDFTLDARTTGPVVRICRALDGMPLAIELAAARLRTLPVEVLADRLADRFRLLTNGSRTALPRHQTLRAVVDWSWDLLDDNERALWRRFSIFHGGAEVTAVEQVCGADVDLLGALVDKSLLVLTGDRYRMLETIREYGRNRLAEAGETERMRLAHARYLLELATAAEPELRRSDQLTWLRRLGAEHDNLHAAVRAAIDAGDARTATALTARLGWYWWLRGHRAEGCALARDVLALTGETDPEDRALAYTYAAMNGLEGAAPIDEVVGWFGAAERQGAGPGAAHPVLRLLRPLSAIFQAGGQVREIELVEPLFDDPDPWLRAISKMLVAQLRLNFGQSPDLARAELREALDGFRATGERWGIGFSLSSLGDMAAARGDFEEAVGWQREAITLVREVGIREDLPQLEMKLAQQLWLAGHDTEARRMLEQARESAEDVGLSEVMASVEYGYATLAREEGALDEARRRMARAAELIDASSLAPQFRAMTHSGQALIEGAAGDLAAARDLHVSAVEIAADTRDSPVMAQTLVGVADYALRLGEPARAAMLLGAADAVRGSEDRSVLDTARIRTAARAALGDAGYAEAYRSGADVTLETALAATGL